VTETDLVLDETPEGLPIVVLTGEVDLARAPALQETFEQLLSAGRSTIVVDLLNVTFLDSTALGVLVVALGRCQKAGGDLHLILADPRILKVFEITGLADAFPFHPTRTGISAFATGTELQ
jgi:anti-sigma B factor antagonist